MVERVHMQMLIQHCAKLTHIDISFGEFKSKVLSAAFRIKSESLSGSTSKDGGGQPVAKG